MDELPQVAHPTAKAFFDALDQHNEKQEGKNHDANPNDQRIKKLPVTARLPQSVSASLKNKSQSLGWRNRYSQNQYYPVTVLQSSPPLISKENTSCVPEKIRGDNRLRPRNFSVLQVQRGEVEGTYGTGATVWPAAMVLIKYLQHNNSYGIRRDSDNDETNIKTDFFDDFVVTLKGKHVIDLGAGTAVTSIAAALLGAGSVVCTDGEDSVVRLAHSNIQRASDQLSHSLFSSPSKLHHQSSQTLPKTKMTQPSGDRILSTNQDYDDDDLRKAMIINDCPIRAQKYWWGDETYRSLMGSAKDNGLVILVADCVLPKLYPIAPLVQAIDECLKQHDDNNKMCTQRSLSSAPPSSYAILSYEHRYYPEYDPRIEFRRLASKRSLDVHTVPRDAMDPIYSLEDVEIWIVHRRHC